MDLGDNGAQVEGASRVLGIVKNKFVLIVAALAGLGVLGVFALLFVFVGALFPARRSASSTAVPTVQVVIAKQASTETPAVESNPTQNPSPTFATPASTSAPPAGPVSTEPPPTPAASKALALAAKPWAGNPSGGIYISRLRVEPANPRKNEPINFTLTLVNATGAPRSASFCVEIYRPGELKSFGITYCPPQSLAPGTLDLETGAWVVTGIHACLPVRARAITRDGTIRTPLTQVNGADSWVDFQVCP